MLQAVSSKQLNAAKAEKNVWVVYGESLSTKKGQSATNIGGNYGSFKERIHFRNA